MSPVVKDIAPSRDSGAQRILIFGDASSVHLQRWVAHMAQRGFEVHVVTRLVAPVPGAASVRTVRAGRNALGWFAALPQIREITREIAPHWVHGHYVTSYGLWAAASGAHPVVLTAWGSDILVTPKHNPLMRALVRWTLRRADLITADSADMLEAITAYRSPAACRLISWGADTDFFSPAAREPHGFDVVSLRSWEANYNIDIVLKAFARFISTSGARDSRLHVLGGGSLDGPLRELAHSLGLQDCVVFHGRVDDEAMRSVLQACRVSVSVPTSDATSVSVLESMSCALAVIASDLPANRACLTEGGPGQSPGGMLVCSGEVQALSEALLQLYRAADTVRDMGQRNRAWVLEHASRQAHMAEMAGLYRRLRAR